jgi:glycosyltransferase involved in cell wall biosynthesis
VEEKNFIYIVVGMPSEFRKVGNVSIGITAGVEATKIPADWVPKMNGMDAIIVPSSFIKELFKTHGVTTPIHVVAEGVDIEIFNDTPPSSKDLSNMEFPTKFNFLYGGQWLPGKVGEERKGIGLLIQAFLEEFKDDENVGLVLKTFSRNNSSVDRHLTKDRISLLKGKNRELPRINLIHGDMSDIEMSALYKHPNIRAFISPTCGEGWHRMLAESVACDLPVAVTGWSGHMDYIDKDKNTVLPFQIAPVSRTALRSGFFPSDAQWAYVAVDDIKKVLRKMYTDIKPYKNKAIEYGGKFRSLYNKTRTYRSLIDIVMGFSKEVSERRDPTLMGVDNFE